MEATAGGRSTGNIKEMHLIQSEPIKFHQKTGDAVYFHFFVKLRATFHRTTTDVYLFLGKLRFTSNFMQIGTDTPFAKVSKIFSLLSGSYFFSIVKKKNVKESC